MNLEFLAEGSPDCPLIRLYSFTRAEVLRLREIADQLTAERIQVIALHDEPGIKAIDGCHLELRLGKRDEDIVQPALLQFECILSDEGWLDVSGLLQPFCETNTKGFQWLVWKGPISLLLSVDGKW
jgi:hypothetical protein